MTTTSDERAVTAAGGRPAPASPGDTPGVMAPGRPTLAAHAPVDTGLAPYLLRLGDDALVLGQRLCQWITRAPMIEEDLALSNIALDLVGHARTLLTLAGRLDGTGRTEDDLAFTRREREFTNTLLTELPNGDFAVTMARQLAYTHYASLHYEALAGCPDAELAAFGARAAKEVAFHRLHADRWIRQLGRGTARSAHRMQQGLERVWPYTGELFDEDDLVRRLAAAGTVPSPAPLRPVWEQRVTEVVTGAGLRVPTPSWEARGGRSGLHTEEFAGLIGELQSVHRQFPGGTW